MNSFERGPVAEGGFHLEPAQIERFEQQGYLSPLAVLTDIELVHFRSAYEAFLEGFDGRPPPHYKHKLHLMYEWADKLVHHPAVLDPVESILGPDLLCWTSNLLVKEPGGGSFVSFHQDATYWGLEPHEVVTAWIALSPSTARSGCVEVVPGSHRGEMLPHVDTFASGNMLTRGQEVAAGVAPETVHKMELQGGEMSLHHIRLVHGSGKNHSDEVRIGLAIRFMSARVRKEGRSESALLVRGETGGGSFLPEQRPETDYGLPGRVAQNRAVRLQLANSYLPRPGLGFGERVRLALRRRLSEAGLDLLYLGLRLRGLFRGGC
ncbi:MAG: phytanoyl-CoA dioxygenase family protein [Myxococcota bacterium]|nr:phytanoyl-CoA dioxygenase family protein [Myxococcota bacterium]